MRIRFAARQVATAQGARSGHRRVRPRAVVRGGRRRAGTADPRRPRRGRHARRRPDGHRAARQPAICCSPEPARRRHASSAVASWRALVRSALRAARRGVRRARAAVAADRPRAAAPRRAPRGGPRRAAGDLLPAEARGSPGAVALAPGRPLGAGGARGHPPDAAADPPSARPAGGRRATVDLARPRRGSPMPGSSPVRPATGTCTARWTPSSRR